LGAELERVPVGRDDARPDPGRVRAGRERRDHVVGLPALELEVPVAEGLDDRPEVGELLAEQVGHRPAPLLVDHLGRLRDRGAVHRPGVPRDGDAPRAVVGEQLEEHVREAEERVRRAAVARGELLREGEEGAVGEVVAVDEEELGLAGRRVVELELRSRQGLGRHGSSVRFAAPVPSATTLRVPRVPLLAGTRIAVVDVGDGGLVLRPPPPGRAIADVGAAVREALRFPLAGPPLERLATRGGTATLVVEPPHLPIPSAVWDPRQEAVAAAVDELEALGVERLTVLVATGLQKRLSPREIGLLFRPEFRRRFRGRVIVHDAEAEDLVALGAAGAVPLRVSPALVETDLVVAVTAAETVVAGGPSALLRCASTEAMRAAGATSLLETAGSNGWELAVELERQLAPRVPLFGVSLALHLPRVFGGYPYEEDILERLARSRLRRALGALPAAARGRLIDRVPRELTAAAVFGGTPSA